MAGLSGKTIATSYKSILRVDNDTNGVGTSSLPVTDGEGTLTCLEICDDFLRIQPADDNTIGTLTVRNSSADIILSVDTSNNVVKVNSGQEIANTQYAYFSANVSHTSANTAGIHYPLLFGNGPAAVGVADEFAGFGNSTDPATSLTTAEATDQRGSGLVPFLWYIPDNISVDAVYSLEGADTATGDTTRFHLMSYTFTSGSTSCLADGTLIAHNSDTTNAGSEQVYKSTFTVDSASVSGGKVLVATFEADGNNSDYSYQVIVKYHLV